MNTTAKNLASKIGPKTRQAVNRGLSKAGLDGNTMFASRAAAYRAACNVLSHHHVQVSEVVDSYDLTQSHRSYDLEFKGSDPFAPVTILDSMLVLTLADMKTGIEAIAYLS